MTAKFWFYGFIAILLSALWWIGDTARKIVGWFR